MKFYNQKNEEVYNQLTEEQQDQIRAELQNYKTVPNGKSCEIEKIEIFEEDGKLHYRLFFEVYYDEFSVQTSTSVEVGYVELEEIFNIYLNEKLDFDFEDDEERAIEEVKKIVLENKKIENYLVNLIEEDETDYLNRKVDRENHHNFDMHVTLDEYNEAEENHIFENLDDYISYEE